MVVVHVSRATGEAGNGVASALGLTKEPREEWGAFDLEVPDCGTVEVKSAAYIQSWEQKEYSRISFDIAERKSAWNPKTGKWKELDPPERIADVYVFCLLKHKCQKTIDPLNVEQWEFYVVHRSQLDCNLVDLKLVRPTTPILRQPCTIVGFEPPRIRMSVRSFGQEDLGCVSRVDTRVLEG